MHENTWMELQQHTEASFPIQMTTGKKKRGGGRGHDGFDLVNLTMAGKGKVVLPDPWLTALHCALTLRTLFFFFFKSRSLVCREMTTFRQFVVDRVGCGEKGVGESAERCISAFVLLVIPDLGSISVC